MPWRERQTLLAMVELCRSGMMAMLNSHRRMPQERRIGMRGYNHLTPSSL